MSNTKLIKYTKRIFKAFICLVLILIIFLETTYLLISNSNFMTKFAIPEISKRSGIKITTEELNLKIFSGISAKGLEVSLPNGLEIKAQAVNLSFVFKKLFEDIFELNNLRITGLKLSDPKIGMIQTDLDLSGTYRFTGRRINANLAGEFQTISLKNYPTLKLKRPAKLNLNLDFDQETVKSIIIQTKLENLDLDDSKIGSSKGNLEFNGTYSVLDASCKGELKSNIKKLNTNLFPKFVLETGTSFSSTFNYDSNGLKLNKFSAKLQPQEHDLLQVNGEGKINLKKNDFDFKLDLASKSIDLKKLLSFFESVKTETEVLPAPDEINTSKKTNKLNLAVQYKINADNFVYGEQSLLGASATGSFLMPKSQRPDLAEMPGNLSYQFNILATELGAKGLVFKNINSIGLGTNEALKIEQFKLQQGAKASVESKGTLNFKNDQFSLYLDLKDLRLETILPTLCGDQCQAIKGLITNAKIALQGLTTTEKFRESLTGTVTMSGDNVFLPAKLQDVPPINILFLPYTIVSDINSMAFAKILPENVVEVSSKADNAISDTGRIKINDFDLQVVINQEAFDLQKADFVFNLVPSANFSGSIYKNRSLNLELGLWIFGVQLRVPVGGSTYLPLPQLYKLPLTLVKGLGLSVIDLFPGEDK